MTLPTTPDFTHETHALTQGHIRIAGVDEVGRGPLAGPVTAAAVRLDPARIPAGLNDSKKLTAARRLALEAEIWAVAEVSVAHASVEEIDELNILWASHLAMRRAVAGLGPVCCVLVDGNLAIRDLGLPCVPLVKGDARCLSIAAASIVAKVARDRLMTELAAQFPGYGWERNAGYPTADHQRGLQTLGITPHHRRSFKTIHKML
ncbi:ribonuclease HII [Falsirhodobacter halotolerans]|uniref:ribonuclease HII n=1 Tax=Falsirhodobacter halotolerans TaxID=1146892 RepID=UPI001FD5BB5D|nr:ribonuclease HII [Falsirhodobacter halotolerans]MCJ8140640.1 ribonuclease HII [Falsirhodobacter halotolerans]